MHIGSMSSTTLVGKGCLEELKNLTDFSALLKSPSPVLVDFSAVYQEWRRTISFICLRIFFSWCGPCKMLSPILDEVAQKNQNWHFVKVDVDKFPSLANDYSV